MNKKHPWVSLLPHGGWRVHAVGEKDDIQKLNMNEAVRRAREIIERHVTSLKNCSLYRKLLSENSYGRNPFPPRVP
jgi:hypothetical protein